MILIRDAIKVSFTKLRIRKVRLIVTLVIASLLFSVAIVMVTAVKGIVTSVETMNTQGLSNRYFAAGNLATYTQPNDPELLEKVQAAQKAEQDQKKIVAKKLGIEYDPKAEQPWVESTPDGQKYLNYSIASVNKIMIEHVNSNPNSSFAAFKDLAENNGAINAYRITSEYGGYNMSGSGVIKVIKDGKESFKENTNMNPYEAKGFASIEGTKMRVADDELVQPFVLENRTIIKDSDNYMSALVPFSVAQEALGLSDLPKDAKPEQKLERIQKVRKDVIDKSVMLCYRNDSSYELISAAISQQQEAEKNKNVKDYIKPALQYGLPVEPCGAATIIRDARTNDQKKLEAKQLEFDQLFGKEPPVSYTKNVKIIGVLPDMADIYSNNIAGILSGLLGSSVGGGWVAPISTVDSPEAQNLVSNIEDNSNNAVTFIAEFKSADDQNNFIKNQSCDLSGGGDSNVTITPVGMVEDMASAGDPNVECPKQDKYFMLMPFGNNAAAIDEFKIWFDKAFKVVLIVIAVISSIVMMGMIGRIIADSRRETAVFRAIGATRLDMAIVYGIYTFLVATLVIISALAIGLIITTLIDNHFSPQVTPSALLVFNVSDLSQEFKFIGLDIQKLLQISAVAYAATFIGLIFPLLANLRRSPLKDMRDEN